MPLPEKVAPEIEYGRPRRAFASSSRPSASAAGAAEDGVEAGIVGAQAGGEVVGWQGRERGREGQGTDILGRAGRPSY